MTASGNRLISSICYMDAPAAIKWLEQAFGFRPHLVVPGENGEIMHSQLIAEDGCSMIMLFSARTEDFYAQMRPPQVLNGGSNQSLYLVVEDVDAYYQRAMDAGATSLLPPTDQDYGGSCCTVADPEGHVWSFGSYDPWAETEAE